MTAAASGGPQLLRPFRVSDFRFLFTGESISVLGDHFHFVALAALTLQLTGSGLALGSVLMVAPERGGVVKHPDCGVRGTLGQH